MINNSEFADRLKQLMDYYQLSASGFADRIQIQRSSISHLLSGRNKPSLDFVLRVIKEFNEVELYWLLNGKGSFPAKTLPTPTDQEILKPVSIIEKSPNKASDETNMSSDQPKKIERIVIFFEDGTFKEYLK
jgi:transcriptional regulator with XRE-family HTH domain